MAEPSDLTPNQEEIRKENEQPKEENRQQEQNEGTPAEASEGPTGPEERTKKGKEKVAEEEVPKQRKKDIFMFCSAVECN